MDIKEFGRRWWESVRWMEDAPGKAKAVWQYVLIVLAFLGVPASALLVLLEGFRPFAGYLLIPFIAYAAWKGGEVLNVMREPSVEVGPLKLDALTKHFYVMLKNGPVPAKVRASIGPILDSSGVVLTERAWEGHWRRREGKFDGDLQPGVGEMYGLLQVGQHPSGNPTLWVYTKEDSLWDQKDSAGHAHVPIWRDVPLAEQKRIIINLTVNCEAQECEKDKPRRRAKPKEMTFAIDPDPGSVVGYKVPTVDNLGAGEPSFWAKAYRRLLRMIREARGVRRKPRP